MATIIKREVVITCSKLVKDNQTASINLPEGFIENLEAIVQELIGDDLIVEVE
jgi:hypothetical protein